MALEYIFTIIDSNTRVAKRGTRIGLILGIIFVVMGEFISSGARHSERSGILILFWCIGLLFVSPWALDQFTNWTGKRAEKYKDLLQYQPKDLVWAYVFHYNNRGHVTISVIMKFRGGRSYSVSDKAIPGRDTKKLLLALYDLNPAMHLGYTRDLEHKYQNRLM